MVYELTRAQQYLYLRLRNTPEVTSLIESRIYEAPAPQDAVVPYLLIDHRAGIDTSTGTVRVSSQLVFAIEVVTESSSNLALEPIYDAIDESLEGAAPGTYRDMIIDHIQRDANYADWGYESGQARRHVGALWRMFIRPLVLAP